jgi:hypothetical protein
MARTQALSLLLLLALSAAPLARAQEAANPSVRARARSSGAGTRLCRGARRGSVAGGRPRAPQRRCAPRQGRPGAREALGEARADALWRLPSPARSSCRRRQIFVATRAAGFCHDQLGARRRPPRRAPRTHAPYPPAASAAARAPARPAAGMPRQTLAFASKPRLPRRAG